MKKAICVLFSLLPPAVAAAQVTVPPPVVSPRDDYGSTNPVAVLYGAFSGYRTGAVEGTYYYLLSTNNYLVAGSHPPGECSYLDLVYHKTRTIGEQVVGYRGNNTFALLDSSNPAFTRYRTVSPCFDGRFGEATEQQHRTGAYGGGSTIVSTSKAKAYEIVNRTRIRKTPTSTSPYELASNGADWNAGDFDQILIGAKPSLDSALTTFTSSSGSCSGQLNPPASQTCNPAFAWNIVPIVLITDNLADPVDGQLKTFTALPPQLAEYDSTVESLPLFSGIGALGATLFGFMQFGNICTAWDTSKNPPVCTQSGFPDRLAAVFITDPSTTIRPSQARLYFKQGASWIGMNADGTFPTVPDDFNSKFNMGGYSDIKYDPTTSTWKLWGTEVDTTATTGCQNKWSTTGSHLAYSDLRTYAKTTLWPTRNGYGRYAVFAHYVYSGACNCLREFIFYSSTDYACYNVQNSPYNYNGAVGLEVLVRRTLDGPPN